MSAHLIRPVLALMVLAACCPCPPAGAQSTNGVYREAFTDLGGNSLSTLYTAAKYPNSPDVESVQTNGFEAPTDWGDNYGQRMRALLLPPATGAYQFAIAGDDQSELYLSTDADPAHRVLIASIADWTSSREYVNARNQTTQISSNINLVAGQRYYIEAFNKEGGGGDNLSVTWRRPGDPAIANNQNPIPNNYLIPVGLTPPQITQQPVNVTVVENTLATFSVTLARYAGTTFQWKRLGTNIPGATTRTVAFGPAQLGNSGNTFFCAITNAIGGTNTATVTLTVQADVVRPALASVTSLGEPDVLTVVFSEPVEPASALARTNYTIHGGITVLRATPGPDATSVILTTSPLTPGTNYILSVSNVRDRASTPNTIVPNSQLAFSLVLRPITFALRTPARETFGPASRRHGVVISEIMYHPTNRTDGRNVEFVEIANTQPWFEELGGWRLTGDIDFVFPSNTVLAAGAYLVVAASPADVIAVYARSNILGPWNGGGLPNSGGSLRLRNRRGAIISEVTYGTDVPFPPAADGAGHSLALARPSLGTADPRAWGLSDRIGGSPGIADTVSGSSLVGLMINEYLTGPGTNFIELYNGADNTVTLTSSSIGTTGSTNRFTFASGTTMAARTTRVLTPAQLGFPLTPGEVVFVRNSTSTRIVDAVRLTPREPGISVGRSPDGAPALSALSTPTPGAANSRPLTAPVVINELMYDPVSGDPNDEYVELHNPGTNAVDVSGWRLRDAIQFTLPGGTTVAAGGYLVIARDVARLRTNHPALPAAVVQGGYSGSLGNNGDRVELTRPDIQWSTNAAGQVNSTTSQVMVDEVSYRSGGRWGRWAERGGSSLELIDPRADRRLGPNWADSDESGKGSWVTVEATGTLDHGYPDANSAYQLHVTLMGAGECLLDDVQVIPSGGANLVPNGGFEVGTDGWVSQGNHNTTSHETNGAFTGSRSLHLRATGRGDSGANRVRVGLTSIPAPGTTVTLRARARWLKGNPNLLLRLRGNWLEAPGQLLTTRALGTPGAPNSRRSVNAGPAITGVRHEPAVPTANQTVTVLAEVSDPDGLAYLAVRYRLDPETNLFTISMTNHGGGSYSASLPGRAAGTLAAFHIVAQDNAASPGITRFPDDAPQREALILWGDALNPGTLGTYRFWMTKATADAWSTEEKMSNRPKDITFVYGTSRVIYNAGAMFHGSPYHSPAYNSPLGNSCDYDLIFPGDERLLGERDVNLFRPGNGGGEGTAQYEIHANWFGGQLGLPHLYQRPVFVLVNGLRRDNVYHDAQQPNDDFIEQWYPDDPDGDLHKIMLGFEFGDTAFGNGEPGYGAVGANLARYLTTGNVKKLARYRQTWPRRAAAPPEQNDYTNLFALVDAANTNAAVNTDAYTIALTNAVDVDEWFRVHVVQHLVGNNDSFSYGGGQNAFAYKPRSAPWQLFLWDIDFAFQNFPGGTNTDLFGIGGADHGPRNDHNPFLRLYWQALLESANGMMTPARSTPIIDSRYNGMIAAGAAVGAPDNLKAYIAGRRAYILGLAEANRFPWAVTTGVSLTTNRNTITVDGTAPLEVRTLLVNGIAYPVTWTSLSTWRLTLVLGGGANTFVLTGVDPSRKPVGNATTTVTATYTGPADRPQDRLVINEVHFDPRLAGTEFVELVNTSTNTAFDLSGWRLDGTGFEFPGGSFIEPGAFRVVAADRAAFTAAFGSLSNLAGVFPGALDNGGETLRLVRPPGPAGPGMVISAVTYDDDPPWPGNTRGTGASLQLVDPTRDAARVANWAALSWPAETNAVLHVTITNGWRYSQTAAFSNLDWTLPDFNDSAWPSNRALFYNENNVIPARTNTILALGRTTYYFRTRFQHTGELASRVLTVRCLVDDGAVLYLNGREILRVNMASNTIVTYTNLARSTAEATSFQGPFVLPATDLRQGDNVLAVEVHQASVSSPDVVWGGELSSGPFLGATVTPGRPNSLAARLAPFPQLWLNEVQPWNVSGTNDNLGEFEPWVELHNGGTNAIPLGGFRLVNQLTNTAGWSFPTNAVIPPGGFRIVWLDGQPEQSTATDLHTPWRADPETGSIALIDASGPRPYLLDYLTYEQPGPGRSYGDFPETSVHDRQTFGRPTPGGTNDATQPVYRLWINEWMADNVSTLADPADQQFEDWFELYNPGTNDVALGGFFLSDSLTNQTQFRVPPGFVVPAGGFLLVWADSEPGQSDPATGALHTNFRLSAGGDGIGLFAPDGSFINGVVFPAQLPDRSQGRFPDGTGPVMMLTNATPGSANRPAPNTPPRLAFLPDRQVHQGIGFMMTISATDTDRPPQSLTFTLPTAPAAVTLGSDGTFVWPAVASALPGTYPVTIQVTDNGTPPRWDQRSLNVIVLPRPALGAVTRDGPNLGLAWPSIPGARYQLEAADHLPAVQWNPAGPVITATTDQTTATVPVEGGSQRFYRLRLLD